MSAEHDNEAAAPADTAAEDESTSVFGNLPQTRPGARSPRRDAQDRKPKPRRSARPATESPGVREPAERPHAQPADPAGPTRELGIEDVAWAGVAAAAEAATIGVRLATRTLEAMRDAVDRR